MAPIFIPTIFSVFIVIGFFGLLSGFILWVIRKLNKGVTNRKLRRKLSTTTMGNQK
ncbi:MAG: hypothetical protein KAU62_15860 [Candidatus Heimdallarchaeota archaeon]|nr:hypothetical protein [Candidatus Heimdallarchaeota archaeon]MCG3257580.1 hypothetical protein [Candidatus Heimdallarchaeota archaeon]MCK4612632.1 hypothetical protein [Candidatus Heimdallarchaeota archaeon]